MYGCCAIALRPSPHIHEVLMQVISLARIIAGGVTDEAAGMMQHGHHCLKGRDRFGVTAVGSKRLGGCTEDRGEPHEERNKHAFHTELAPE
jgi:hypothetical protein